MRRALPPAAAALLAALLASAGGCGRKPGPDPLALIASYAEGGPHAAITIRYPLPGTVFPPEIPPPTFRWTDPAPASASWVVGFSFADGAERIAFRAPSGEWTPPEEAWEAVKRRSLGREAAAHVLGIDGAGRIASAGALRFSTSADEVGAPLFYREVNLPFVDAVKDPSRIRWRFGPVSSRSTPPVVLENLPVCGNCHSFSADGRVLGMDIDYANDKGSYALVRVDRQMVLDRGSIITWNDCRREDGEPTFGLLSQVSPDGRHVVSTVKDRSVFVPRPGIDFSQLFFPVKGILASYERSSGTFRPLPGADDPRFVNSNPAWSPDGRHVVFARSPAHPLLKAGTKVLLTEEDCAEFLREKKPFKYDLYRVPFNGGAGGEAKPVEGASRDGTSNYFPKYSPDGRWIVFCKAENYSLLQPDSALYIMPAEGGPPRRMLCNTPRMNSWHTWSPNGKWLVFSSKANSPYTQLFITHVDGDGRDTPPVVLDRLTSPDRAANIPEFVNAAPDAIVSIAERFVDDVSFTRAAKEFLVGGDFERAIQAYRRAISLNPRNADAHANLGAVLDDRGRPAEAAERFRAALEINPNDAGTHYNLGVASRKIGDTEGAVRHYLEAIRLDPADAKPRSNLGSIFIQQRLLREAEAQLEEAVRLDPRHAQARNNMGTLRMAQGRAEEAVACYEAAVRIDPGYARAHSNLGAAKQKLGRHDEAALHYQEALRLDPTMEEARRNLETLMRRPRRQP